MESLLLLQQAIKERRNWGKGSVLMHFLLLFLLKKYNFVVCFVFLFIFFNLFFSFMFLFDTSTVFTDIHPYCNYKNFIAFYSHGSSCGLGYMVLGMFS